MDRQKILVADDHELVRTGLKLLLNDNEKYEFHETGTGDAALNLLNGTSIDVLLLDIGMPLIEGEIRLEDSEYDQCVRQLMQRGVSYIKEDIFRQYGGLVVLCLVKLKYPSVKVVILSQHDGSGIIDIVQELDADGFLNKAELNETIIYALEQLRNSKKIYSETILKRLKTSRKDIVLSPRELEILEMIAGGFKDREIAERLDITPRTVSFHKVNLKEKLDAESTADLIAHYYSRLH